MPTLRKKTAKKVAPALPEKATGRPVIRRLEVDERALDKIAGIVGSPAFEAAAKMPDDMPAACCRADW